MGLIPLPLALPAVWCLLLAVVALSGQPSRAADGSTADVGIEAFYGTFEGQAAAGTNALDAPRDLSVTIAPTDRGFVVSWTTVIRETDGQETRKAYTIAFQPTHRAGVYRSAMRTNVFGERMPLDPFSGDPFVWARLSGRTLTVFALIILDDGSYDLQIYDRSLSDDGLRLVFSRWIEQAKVAEVRADLVRVAP